MQLPDTDARARVVPSATPPMPKPPKATSSKPNPKAAPKHAKGTNKSTLRTTKLTKGAGKATSRAKSSATNLAKDSQRPRNATKLANATAAKLAEGAGQVTKLAKSTATKLAKGADKASTLAKSAATKIANAAAKATTLAKSSATKLAKDSARSRNARVAQTSAAKLARTSGQAGAAKLVDATAAKPARGAKLAAAAKPARAAKATPPPADDLPIISFESAADWTRWLDQQHKTARGLWLKFARKGSGIASVDRTEAVDGALCYGWIDGQGRSFDEHYYLTKFTPRGARSIWSKINRVKVQTLIEQGLMKPAGLAEVERAQRDGRWDAAYDSPRTAAVPDDLAVALNAHPRARASFAELNAANRYAILWQLQTAKKAETRARRISRFIDMLERGETLH